MSSINALGGGQWATTHMPRLAEARQKMFDRVDADASGSVDATELQASLDKVAEKTGRTPADATQVMQQADRNGDGTLNAKELGVAVRGQLPSTVDFAQQRSEKIFSKLDADGSGTLSADELNKVVDPLIQRAAGDGGADASAQAQTETAVFNTLDSDGDGSISQGEFASLMAPPREAVGGGTPHSPPDLTTQPPGSPPDLGTGGGTQGGTRAGHSAHAFQMPALNALVSSEYAQIAAGTGDGGTGSVNAEV